MLVLSRKENESIVIGGQATGCLDCNLPEVRVCVIEVRGDKVRLGIEAPRDVPVHRQEIWVRIQQEKGVGCQGSGVRGSATDVAPASGGIAAATGKTHA